MGTWFLYLIRCKDGTLYTGITTDVERRFVEHQGNDRKGAKYLRGRAPLALAFKTEIGNRSLASKVELKVKRMTKAEKEMLVQGKIAVRGIVQSGE